MVSFRLQMNMLLISIFAVASLSIFPTKTVSTTTDVHHQHEQEPPLALPLTSSLGAAAAAIAQNNGGEIWQEDDREVLIRNERGTKNSSNNSGSGKKEKVKKVKPTNTNTKPLNSDAKAPSKLHSLIFVSCIKSNSTNTAPVGV